MNNTHNVGLISRPKSIIKTSGLITYSHDQRRGREEEISSLSTSMIGNPLKGDKYAFSDTQS